MPDMKKADQQVSLKETPLGNTNSCSQRLIAPPEAECPHAATLDGIGFLPFGTQAEKE